MWSGKLNFHSIHSIQMKKTCYRHSKCIASKGSILPQLKLRLESADSTACNVVCTLNKMIMTYHYKEIRSKLYLYKVMTPWLLFSVHM